MDLLSRQTLPKHNPRLPLNGREVRNIVAHTLGLTPTMLSVYHENPLVVSQRKLVLQQGVFLRIELALDGGNWAPWPDETAGKEVYNGTPKPPPFPGASPHKMLPTPSYRSSPLVRTPTRKLMNNYKMGTPRQRNGEGAADPNLRFETPTQNIGRSRYEWFLSRKTRNNKIHTENGNPEEDQPHTNPNPKQNSSPSHHPALLLQRHTNTSPVRSTARAALRTKWAAMIRLAKRSAYSKLETLHQ